MITPKISFWLFTLLLPLLGQGQDAPLKLLHTISITTKFITTDKLQQLYVITPQNTVIKFSPDGNEQYRFANNTLGELGYVDATDPFNLLLYYPDYQLVVTLDRTMNEISRFNLLEAGILQTHTVGLSNEGNIWVYDEARFVLEKLARTGEVLLESQNLSLVLNQPPQPVQIIAQDNFVYLNDPAQGILVFDNFGQYAKTIPIKNIARFQILEDYLVHQQEKELLLYDLKTFLISKLHLSESTAGATQVQIQKNRLFAQKSNAIEIYNWQ